ncbi:hypothetical protein PIB30_108841, partial [Stylosanthes scabra]|nr:hypothetical protein [Stylosanthes scabra]
KERKKPFTVAVPTVDSILRRVLFTAIGAPSTAAPCSLIIAGKRSPLQPPFVVAAPSVALLPSALPLCRKPSTVSPSSLRHPPCLALRRRGTLFVSDSVALHSSMSASQNPRPVSRNHP